MSSDAGSSNTDAVFAAVAAHMHFDLSSMSRAGLQGELSLLGRGSGWIDARRAAVTRALLGLSDSSGSAEQDVAAASKSSLSRANSDVKRAGTLGEVPEMSEALGNGSVSTEHVDKLTSALDRVGDKRAELAADGAGLAELAASTTPGQFGKRLEERIARLDESEGCERLAKQKAANRFKAWTNQITGMLELSGALDPETGLAFVAALEAAVETMFHGGVPPECPEGESRQDWLRAMALVRLVTGAGVVRADDEVDDIETVGDNTEIIVVVDLDTLMSGLHKGSIIDPGH
ncbi:MAG: hypothetical protein JWM34_2289, partial [Ilumatobacteraceae bacterium]|nr:hypothetical protein [Ilumatobacteraceae bacterium]